MKEDLPNFIPFAPEKRPNKFSKATTPTVVDSQSESPTSSVYSRQELIKSFNLPNKQCDTNLSDLETEEKQ